MIFNLQQSVAPIWSKMSTALQLDLFDDDHDDHYDDHDGVDEYDDYHDDDHDKDGNWCSSTIKLFDVKHKSFTQGLLSDIWIWPWVHPFQDFDRHHHFVHYCHQIMPQLGWVGIDDKRRRDGFSVLYDLPNTEWKRIPIFSGYFTENEIWPTNLWRICRASRLMH